MCRGIAYIGKPVGLKDLLFDSPYSLREQSVDPRYMYGALNLSGNGFVSWHKHEKPILYKSDKQICFDYNLARIGQSIQSDVLLAHIRGGSLNTNTVCSYHNAHPFMYDHSEIAFCHNGGLDVGSGQSKKNILHEIKKNISPERYSQMLGTTDSEILYALILTMADKYPSSFSFSTIEKSIYEALSLCYSIRKRNDIYESSPMNLFVAHRDYIIVLRYTYDFGVYSKDLTRHAQAFYSMWFTLGEGFSYEENDFIMTPGQYTSFCCSSEPLSRDTANWFEVPEYTLITVMKEESQLSLNLVDFDL